MSREPWTSPRLNEDLQMKPTGERQGYPNETGQAVECVAYRDDSIILGALWIAEDGEAIGIVDNKAAGARGRNAGYGWVVALLDKWRQGLTPRQAFDAFLEAGELEHLGSVLRLVPDTRSTVESLAALKALAAQSADDTPQPESPATGPSPYPAETDGPVHLVSISNPEGIIGFLWVADAGDAAGWLPRAKAGAGGGRAAQYWLGRLAEAKARDLTPRQAYEELAFSQEPASAPGYGGVDPGSQRTAPSLDALKDLAQNL